MKIFLVGGGSGGPVIPLIAIYKEIIKGHPSAKFFLVGTQTGPERLIAKKHNLPFFSIHSGKYRRYFSLKNIFSPLQTLIGFFQALKLLRQFRPNCIVGAGSFVQVPVVWAGWWLNIPSVIHQQDVVPSLANKLCEFPATKITVCFENSLADFSGNFGLLYKKNHKSKVELMGNPFLSDLKTGTRKQAIRKLGLREDMPVLLVMGGGTGSEFINHLINHALTDFLKIIQIIHITGQRKNIDHFKHSGYIQFEFLPDMQDAYWASDIVVARAGLSTLTELSNLGKLSIIIPMPHTHQEYNAKLLKALSAALVFDQNTITSEHLLKVIKKLLFDLKTQELLKSNISAIMPKDSSKKITKLILDLIHEKS
jgi:UDP-N-acetylglucosamine--N-acetylmuramyl-(pentapeptide) pyrophosphoryl-undecaprenol N-acetylglucosamine transferase